MQDMWYINTRINNIVKLDNLYKITPPIKIKYMYIKLDLKLKTGNQWKFPISEKFFVLTKVDQVIKDIPWINLFIVLDGEKISFFLDMYPMAKSSLKYRKVKTPEIRIDNSNIDLVVNTLLFSEEMELVPNGFPWSYVDRKTQFANLSETTQSVTFWCGPYTLCINRTYQFFDNIIEMLKRQ